MSVEALERQAWILLDIDPVSLGFVDPYVWQRMLLRRICDVFKATASCHEVLCRVFGKFRVFDPVLLGFADLEVVERVLRRRAHDVNGAAATTRSRTGFLIEQRYISIVKPVLLSFVESDAKERMLHVRVGR